MGYKTYTCPIARTCGGCEWLAVPYPIQLKRKQAYLEELFAEELAQDGAELAPIVGMEEPVGYRHKAASPYAPGPTRAQRHGHGRAWMRSGFYAAGSHKIIRCEKCLVEANGLRDILNDVAKVAQSLHIAAYEEDKGKGVLRYAVVRSGFATGECMLTVVTAAELPRQKEFIAQMLKKHPEITTIVNNLNARRGNAILGRVSKTIFGPGVIYDKLLGCTFEIRPTSFYQTNPAQTEKLYQLAIEGAVLTGKEHILDTYCGTGTIGLCALSELKARGLVGSLTGVEVVQSAVTCARKNAVRNGVQDSCQFLAQDATAYMHALGKKNNGAVDVVFMDPPRAGSTLEFCNGVVACAPKRIVYISCNPETQKRDLAWLRAGGYRVEKISAVDMFPHTKHVETVALLERR
ncbi:MAG: 23S rRNA (uracil(1939)-C(5))-methyltransferase RlmD [Atopobiaceae bacterium]|jgi:23S rRNA (uracil1939-C5)-methyltransferase